MTIGAIAASFQAAFELAETEFVCVLGQDDLIDKNYLARVLPMFKGDVAMVACWPRFVNSDFTPFTNTQDARTRIPKPSNIPKDQMLSILKIGNMYFGINTYVRQAVLDVDDPLIGRTLHPGPAIRFDGDAPRDVVGWTGPAVGADTDYVMGLIEG